MRVTSTYSLYPRSCLVFSLAVALSHSVCFIEDNEDNILASRLEGVWELDYELSLATAPNTYEKFGISQLIVTRNDPRLESVVFNEDFCEEDDVPFYMAGIAEATTLDNQTVAYGETMENY